MDRQVNISILIPSYGRDSLLWDTLSALEQQMREGDEILVIDQNHPRLHPPQELQTLKIRFFGLRPASLTRARNLGIQKAKNEVLLFLDDDIIPDHHLLTHFRELHRVHPNRVIAGSVDQQDLPNIPIPGNINLRSGAIQTRYDFTNEMDLDFFPGGCFLIPKKILPPYPWFFHLYVGNAEGEEIDLALRLKKRGRKILGSPKPRILHLKAPNGGCRSDSYRRDFAADSCWNRGLFFGRHGLLLASPDFYARMRGFIEFHSRSDGFLTHDWIRALRYLVLTLGGFLTGLFTRFRL